MLFKKITFCDFLVVVAVILSATTVYADCAISKVALTGVLNSSAPHAAPPLEPLSLDELSSSATFHMQIHINDIKGVPHPLYLYFYYISEDSWLVNAYADAADVGALAKGFPIPSGSTNLVFGSNGELELPVTFVSTPTWLSVGTKDVVIISLEKVAMQNRATAISDAVTTKFGSRCPVDGELDMHHVATGGVISEETKGIKNPPNGFLYGSDQ